MKADDRGARMLKAAQAVPGVRVYVEGEGRNRRLVFAPGTSRRLCPSAAPLPRDDDELGGLTVGKPKSLKDKLPPPLRRGGA